jgi:uncharacterized repeat protein (TIGR03847 family)
MPSAHPASAFFTSRAGRGNAHYLDRRKDPAQSSRGLEQFLAEIYERFPDLPKASADYVEENMHIHPPLDPLFRTGELGLGYDTENDMVVLIARELLPEDQDPNEANVVRFWCTREQIRALCHWGMEVASRGRPLCPQCGQPMDPEGHFCPKKNGHKH